MTGMEMFLGLAGVTEGRVVQDLALFAAKASLLMGTAFLAVLLLHRASAATRHMVWATAFATLLLLPVTSRVGPRWEVLPAGGTALDALVQTEGEGVGRGVVRAHPRLEPAGSAVTRREVRGSGRGGSDGAAEGDTERLGEASTVRPGRGGAVRRTPPAAGGDEVSPLGPSLEATASTVAGMKVLVLWLIGSGLALLVLLAGVVRVKTMAWRAREIEDPEWTALRDELAAHLGLERTPRLLASPEARVPMTWGILRPCVLLPIQALQWDPGRRRHVLLHEMAHLERRDVAALFLAEVACAVHWFNPLVWFAARRMRMEREHACDDLVLRSGCAASDYAEALLDVVRDLRAPAGPAAVVCMAKPSQLGERLRAVLDPTRSREVVGATRRGLAWGLGLLVVVAAGAVSPAGAPALEAPAGAEAPATVPTAEAPATVPSAVALTPAPMAGAPAASPTLDVQSVLGVCPRPEHGDPESNTTVLIDGARLRGSWVHREGENSFEAGWTGRDCWVRVTIEGEVTFTPGEDDVASVGRRGLFAVQHDENGVLRTLSIEAGSGSALARDYRVDGRAHAYDAEAAAWLAQVIPSLLRETGYQAEERADRLYRQGGVDAVLREVRLIGGDHVEARYLSSLFRHELSESEARAVLEVAGEELEGDYELAELLTQVAENTQMTPGIRQLYIEAAQTLEGDYEQARVYEELLVRQQLGQEELESVLREADRSIEGDYEMAEIYGMLLDQPELSDAYVQLLVESAATALEGDYELAQLLIEACARDDLSAESRSAILEATAALEGDYERAQTMQAFMADRTLAEEELAQLLEQAGQIEGDYEKAQLLEQIAQEQAVTETLTQRYLEAVRGIEGSYELARVLSAFVEQADLTESQMRLLLGTTASLDDYEKGELLMQLAAGGHITAALEDAYIEAAESISGEYERDRALAALLRARRRR